MQLAKLTASFQNVTEDLRRRFVVDGEPLFDEGVGGRSPVLAHSFRRTTGFSMPVPRPGQAASGQKTSHI